MANQFFEVSGIRLDLSKIEGFEAIVSDPVAFVRLDGGGIYVGELTLGKIKKAYADYRESLNRKYQFKDGWYICNVGSALKPANVLRYIKNGLAYSADTCRQMRPALYQSVTMVDHQPPPLFVNDSE